MTARWMTPASLLILTDNENLCQRQYQISLINVVSSIIMAGLSVEYKSRFFLCQRF